jgi:thioredoxin reductase (NADPH)
MQNSIMPLTTLKLYGQLDSREAYIIRDFLKRSVVGYEWIVLDEPEQLRDRIRLENDLSVKLPALQLPGGTILFNPSVSEIAGQLGWLLKPKLMEYDLSIYGAGPAGLSAAVYAASEGLRTIIIEREAIGGQAGTSSLIENYLGFPDGVSGAELAERARQQAVKFGAEILLIRNSVNAAFIDNKLHVELIDGSKVVSKSNICATGVQYRKLNIANEERFRNLGVFYGAGASEAPMCVDQPVFVVGGGNSAGQAAMYFSVFAAKVTMVVRGNNLSSTLSHYLLGRIKKKKNIEVLYNSQLTSLYGDAILREIAITDQLTNKCTRYRAQKVFICIGGVPNTEWARNTSIIRDDSGYFVTGPDMERNKLQAHWKLERPPFYLETSIPGSFAAGDVRHNSVKRVASAVGEGAMAVTFVHKYLQEIH